MYSRSSEPVYFERDCPAIMVPQGDSVTLPAGSYGYITQALGGSYTVFVDGSLFRIAGKDGDAIGKEAPAPLELPADAGDDEVEKLVWQQLREEKLIAIVPREMADREPHEHGRRRLADGLHEGGLPERAQLDPGADRVLARHLHRVFGRHQQQLPAGLAPAPAPQRAAWPDRAGGRRSRR